MVLESIDKRMCETALACWRPSRDVTPSTISPPSIETTSSLRLYTTASTSVVPTTCVTPAVGLGINRLVFTSSVAVYGGAAQGATEEQDPAPTAPYGRSKLRAEQVHREWQRESARMRSLVTVRPTVVFGEGNRGNVYQLLRQIVSGRFLMIGSGENRKSMAYVGNLGAFLVRVLTVGAGAHVFNYVDKPDLSMKQLVDLVAEAAETRRMDRLRIPYAVGYLGGMLCDVAAAVTGRSFPVSAARVRKFCSTTTFSAQRLRSTGFQPALGLREALVRTVRHEIAVDDAIDGGATDRRG